MTRRIVLLMLGTLLEAKRLRVLPLLGLVTTVAVIGGLVFSTFDFGQSELRFLADYGMGVVVLFGSAITLIVGSLLIFSELENRTLLPLLARPVSRTEWLAGRFLGVWTVLGGFILAQVIVLMIVLWWREQILAQTFGSDWPEGGMVNYTQFALYALHQWMRLGVLLAAVCLVSSIGRSSLYVLGVSLLLLIMFQSQAIGHDVWERSTVGLIRVFGLLMAVLVPNFQLFDIVGFFVIESCKPLLD